MYPSRHSDASVFLVSHFFAPVGHNSQIEANKLYVGKQVNGAGLKLDDVPTVTATQVAPYK